MFNANTAPHPSMSALATRVDELREALRQIPIDLLAELGV
jgi:hypothetical protein